ncbi:MAG TPA: hypothetical protein DCM86_12495, partial [Verrucomicrobiales bacterium]|nr:hypothetical protein [Verrucomicrobiales bacterium]
MESQSVILIVDDEPANQRLLESVLRSPAYRIEVASTGEEALAKAAALRPDLMLLDVMMPSLDGFAVCGRVRADPDLGPLPIIMVTAMDDRDVRRKAIEAGADDLLTKPVDREEVRMRVRSITRLNRQRRYLEERDRFEQIAELSRDGYAVLDAEGRITYANPEACRLLRLPEEGFAGVGFLDRLRSEFESDPESMAIGWEAAVDPMRRVPFRVVKPETDARAAFWLEVTSLRVGRSPLGGRLLRLSDVTPELALQRDQWKFHTQMAHKLRTPLVGLVGALEILATDEALLRRPDTQELLQLSRGCVHQLREHVEDVLEYLDAPMIGRMANTFLVAEFEGVVQRAARQVGLAGVKVEVPAELSDSEVRFPLKAMELSLIELLENARKFHPHRSPKVEVRLERTSEGKVVVKVVDDGLTLPSDRLSKVWEPYYQSEKLQTGEVAGMGLGLPMIASMVREQGGVCQLHNRADGPGVSVEL